MVGRSPIRAARLARPGTEVPAVSTEREQPSTTVATTAADVRRDLDLDALRRELLQLRAELLDTAPDLDAEVFRTRSDVSDGSGETEHLVVAEQKDVSARIDALAERSVEEIDEALARMDAGTYGRCVDCGDPIPAERLEAVPAAPTCLRCKAEREHGSALV
jgi:DnaK suppressor protein